MSIAFGLLHFGYDVSARHTPFYTCDKSLVKHLKAQKVAAAYTNAYIDM